MSQTIIEGYLEFSFSQIWHAIKYDDHRDYRDKIEKLDGTKAVDFVAVYRVDLHPLYLIEVKDFRGYRIQNKTRVSDGELAVEVGQKVRDTLAGIIGGLHGGNEDDWRTVMDRLSLRGRGCPVRVVLWLEDDAMPRPVGRERQHRSVIIDDLKRKLRWLTSQVLVVSLKDEDHRIPGLNVKNLPRPAETL